MATTRELVPVFVNGDGQVVAETAQWLLDRAMVGSREDYFETSTLPVRDDAFEGAVAEAEGFDVMQMLARQEAQEVTNASRLAEERRKQERFFDYRSQAAADKLEANRRTLERLRLSPEDDDRRILPVWESNVSTAEAALASVEEERLRRLADLAGRDHVNAQHELLSASFVTIEPDPAPLMAQVESALTPEMYKTFKRFCRRTTAQEITERRPAILHRRQQLIAHARRHAFDVRLAVGLAESLISAVAELDRHSANELTVLTGAIEYLLELDHEAPDLKSPDGFEDDRRVINIVLEAIGRSELRVLPATAAVGA